MFNPTRPSGDAPTRIAVVGFRGVPHVIGGIETHCEHLYPALAATAADLAVTLIGRRGYMPSAPGWFDGVRCVAVSAPGRGGVETLLHTPLAIAHARFRLKADIVHLHGIGPGFFAPFARLLGIRVVVTHHAADFERPKWGRAGRAFLRAGEWLAGRFAARVICVSDAVRAEFLGRVPTAASRTETIRHSIDPPPPHDRDDALIATEGLEHGRYLLAVGRLEETKRFEDLVAAHARSGSPLPLVIVGSSIGDGGYEEKLRGMAGPNVRLLGFRTGGALTALYEGAALFLHASSMEGFGLVILEALAAGTPVTISDLPVHREFGLPDDRYFPVGDIAAIAAAMAQARPRTIPWLGAAAIVARYGTPAAVNAHVALFRRIGRQASQRMASASNTDQ